VLSSSREWYPGDCWGAKGIAGAGTGMSFDTCTELMLQTSGSADAQSLSAAKHNKQVVLSKWRSAKPKKD